MSTLRKIYSFPFNDFVMQNIKNILVKMQNYSTKFFIELQK